MKCRCAATAKRRVGFLGARAKFNPMILQQAEGFKCQPTVAPHQLFATHLPLNTNQRRGSHTHLRYPSAHAPEDSHQEVPGTCCCPEERCTIWSFLRPTLTFFLTSASTREEIPTSPLAYLGLTTKAPSRTGTP